MARADGAGSTGTPQPHVHDPTAARRNRTLNFLSSLARDSIREIQLVLSISIIRNNIYINDNTDMIVVWPTYIILTRQAALMNSASPSTCCSSGEIRRSAQETSDGVRRGRNIPSVLFPWLVNSELHS
jgi:hypothetical protein